MSGLRFRKRRRDWRLGRWTAKLALSRFMPGSASSLSDWEIISQANGAPSVLLTGAESGVHLSLSHSHGRSLVSICRDSLRIGCDLERVERRHPSFGETFFTAAEMDVLERSTGHHRDCLVTLIWSAKESVLKSLQTGLKADTRRIEISGFGEPSGNHWQPFKATDELEKSIYHGWWRNDESMIHTVVASERFNVPVELF